MLLLVETFSRVWQRDRHCSYGKSALGILRNPAATNLSLRRRSGRERFSAIVGNVFALLFWTRSRRELLRDDRREEE